MPGLADVFNRHGDAYLDKYRDSMLPSHSRAIYDIRRCRTDAMDCHEYLCDHCQQLVRLYHSCRNRHCPSCHTKETQAWIKKRRKELLPVMYYHIVFTIPQLLHTLFRSNQNRLYGILIKTAARAVQKLCLDPKYVGGNIGVMAVLHTWTRSMAYHPHVHCLIPGVGVTPDGDKWIGTRRKNFLVPVRALSVIFKGMLGQQIRKEFPNLKLTKKIWRKKWRVYCKPAPQKASDVVEYLARYVHRVAITDRNILSVTDSFVTFGYWDSDKKQRRTMSLPPDKFMHRFLQHVLPRGIQKVRYFGLWHPSKRNVLRRLILTLPYEPDRPESPLSDQNDEKSTWEKDICPHCKTGQLCLLRVVHNKKPP